MKRFLLIPILCLFLSIGGNAQSVEELIEKYDSEFYSEIIYQKVFLEREIWKELVKLSKKNHPTDHVFTDINEAKKVKIIAIPVIRYRGGKYDPNNIIATIDTNVLAGIVYLENEMLDIIYSFYSKGEIKYARINGFVYGTKKNVQFDSIYKNSNCFFYESVTYLLLIGNNCENVSVLNSLFLTLEPFTDYIQHQRITSFDSTYNLKYGSYFKVKYPSSKLLSEKLLSEISQFNDEKLIECFHKEIKRSERFREEIDIKSGSIEIFPVPVIDRNLENIDRLNGIRLNNEKTKAFGYINGQFAFIVDYNIHDPKNFSLTTASLNPGTLETLVNLEASHRNQFFYDEYIGFYCYFKSKEVYVYKEPENPTYLQHIKNHGFVIDISD